LNRWLLAAFAVLLGVGLLSNTTYRKRKQQRAILEGKTEEYVAERTIVRFVDFGIRLRVVEHDPHGRELVDGCPPMRVLREHYFGGMADLEHEFVDSETGLPTGKKGPALVGPSQSPVIWYCSIDQEQILLHDDPTKPAQLVYGSEGAGKTRVIAMFHAMQVLAHFGEKREGGATSPTEARLEAQVEEMVSLYPARWFSYKKAKKLFRFVDGSRVRCKSTHRSSKSAGSPLQSYNWSWASGDEEQDSTKEHDNVTARLRKARGGAKKAPRIATATAKDDAEWRNLRDKLDGSGLWIRRTLLGLNSPFIDAGHWEAMKASMSPREYQRRVLAQDVGPELAVYYAYERSRNLALVPDIGAHDVTANILQQYQSYMRPGARFILAAGHDPGAIYNTTEVARLMVISGVPRWVVVGELQTKQTTAIEHARLFKEYVRDTFDVERIDTDKIATFVDPHGKGDAQTDYQSVYGAFQANGMDVFNPAPISARIKRSARVEMVNRLLGGTAAAPGVPRLLIARDERNQPVAPRLVEAFEQLVKRPGEDDPEGVRKKDEADKTHAPASLGYLLWPFEQQALTEFTVKAALAAAGIRA
jgi:hypothetical protein